MRAELGLAQVPLGALVPLRADPSAKSALIKWQTCARAGWRRATKSVRFAQQPNDRAQIICMVAARGLSVVVSGRFRPASPRLGSGARRAHKAQNYLVASGRGRGRVACATGSLGRANWLQPC